MQHASRPIEEGGRIDASAVALPCNTQRFALAAKKLTEALVKLAACKTLANWTRHVYVGGGGVVGREHEGLRLSPRQEGAALSPRPRALEEADRVRLVQNRRRGGPVVFGEVGDVAHRRVLPAGDRGVEPRRLPPRRRRKVGQRPASEALTCVCFCHLPDLDPRASRSLCARPLAHIMTDRLAARPPASHRGTQTKVSQNQSSGSGFDGVAAAWWVSVRRPRSRGTAARPRAACAAPAPVRRWAAGPAVKFLCRPCF